MAKSKVIFYGGKQAGMIALLTLKALGDNPIVIAEDKIVKDIAESLFCKIIPYESLKNESFDLLVCCHARKIIPKKILDKGLCINIHPCLYRYKGAKPIRRLLKDKKTKASVGCHFMIEKVDEGCVICEKFIKVKGKTEIEIYNELYPLYAQVLAEALTDLKYMGSCIW